MGVWGVATAVAPVARGASVVGTAGGQLEESSRDTLEDTELHFSRLELLLVGALISLILVSIVGNCLVCVAIFTDRRLRKLGNAFIVSLAIADLFVSCLVMTFALCNDLMNYWIFGEWFCDVWISFDIMCCTASILNLCAISLDRFIHIKDCLFYNQWMTRRVAFSAVLVIWFISALVSFVPINLGWHKPNHFASGQQPQAQLNLLHHQQQKETTLINMREQIIAQGPSQRLDAQVASMEREAGGGLTQASSAAAYFSASELHSEDKLNYLLAKRRQKRKVPVPDLNTADALFKRSPSANQSLLSGGKTLRGQLGSKKEEAEGGDGDEEEEEDDDDDERERDRDDEPLGSSLAKKTAHQRMKEDAGRGRLRGTSSARSNKANYDLLGDFVSRPKEEETRTAKPNGMISSGLLTSDKLRARRRRRSSQNLRVEEDEEEEEEQRARELELRVAKNGSAEIGKFEMNRKEPEAELSNFQGSWPKLKPISSSSPGADSPAAADLDHHLSLAEARLRHDDEHDDDFESITEKHSNRIPSSRAKHTNESLKQEEELPMCMLTLTPTYAIISSTISFYIPCIIMLGLYTKLFACARRHVRNIQAISKAPAPIAPSLLNLNQSTSAQYSGAEPSVTFSNNNNNRDSAEPASENLMPSHSHQQPLKTSRSSGPLNTWLRFGKRARHQFRQAPRRRAQKYPTNAQLVDDKLKVGASETGSAAPPPDADVDVDDDGEQNQCDCQGKKVDNLGLVSSGNRSEAHEQLERKGEMRSGKKGRKRKKPDCICSKAKCKSQREDCEEEHDEVLASMAKNSSAQAAIDGPLREHNEDDEEEEDEEKEEVVVEGEGGCIRVGINENRRTNGQFVAPHELANNNNNSNNNNNNNNNYNCNNNNNISNLADDDGGYMRNTTMASECQQLLSESRVPLTRPVNSSGVDGQDKRSREMIGSHEGREPPSEPPTLLTPPAQSRLNKQSSCNARRAAEEEPFLQRGGDETVSRLSAHTAADQSEKGSLLGGGGPLMLESGTLSRQATFTSQRSIGTINKINFATSNQLQYQKQKQQQQQQQQQSGQQLATHKAAITLGIIMGTFLFCWVPFFCLNIIKAFCVDCIPSSVFRAFTWLGYANSALNPIIYGIHNSEFRCAFNRIFFKHLNIKNSRYYFNRQPSFDLRAGPANHHHHHQLNGRNTNRSFSFGRRKSSMENSRHSIKLPSPLPPLKA